jgi:putative two-component system response regulator
MPAQKFIGNDMDSLVNKLTTSETGIKFSWDVVKVIEKEKQDLQAQLFRYAEDIQKLLAESDMADMNEKEKNAAYKQLERFNHDFLILMEQKEKSYKALESSHLDTIRRLAAVAEYKDDDTGVHFVRMSRFSSITARACGQDEEYCDLLEQASPMHDIGKIGIPDNVLKKPGKLTDEEWDCMRKHPEYGASILSGSDVPVIPLAEEVALAHHEKFDGSGYPSNLKGDNIPLSGRIVALADFFDALTMDLCYWPAFSDEKALAMVKENRGIHFDPKIVDAFFSVSEKIIQTRDRINKESEQP